MSDAGYEKDREFGDHFIRQVTSILGQVLIIPANDFEDMHHNTDLTIDLGDRGNLEIAMRVRRTEYINDKFKNQFTLCFHRGSGCDAEYQKITGTGGQKRTWGKYMFYGFSDKKGERLIRWFIGDFDNFRPYVDNIGFFHNPSIEDPYIGTLFFKDCRKIIGETNRVKRIDKRTKDIYYDYFYAYNREAFSGFVIADSDHWTPISA